MQAAFTESFTRVAPSKRMVLVQASSIPRQPSVAPVNRRSAAAAVLALTAAPLLLALPAEAKDAKEALQAAQERKAKLKAAAEAMAKEGKAKAAFSSSNYSMPEDATSPNMRAAANTRTPKVGE